MRVLVLSHSSAVDNLGGAERSMVEFLEQWRAIDPSLELFVVSRAPAGRLQPELDRLGIPWMNLPFTSVVRHRRSTEPGEIYESARHDLTAVRAIERFIVEFRADLVVTNTIVAPWAAIAAKLVPVPHVWFVREYGDGHEFQIPREHVFSDIGILSDLVVTNSEALRDYVAQWVDRDKITVLYPSLDTIGLDAEPAQAPANWPLVSDPVDRPMRLVCVGRIAPSKGQARIVRAVAALRDEGTRVDVALVGSATDREHRDLEQLIVSLGVADQIALTGELADPRSIVALADVGVVASDSEGFGRVTVEFMAAGKPVIGAAVGATVELISHEVTGRLFTLDHEDSLADAIRAYAISPESVEAHGAAGFDRLREHIRARHRLSDLVPRLEELTRSAPEPLTSLPNIMRAWFGLPEIVVDLLFSSGAMVDPKTSRTWRIGHAALVIPRRIKRAFRGQRASR